MIVLASSILSSRYARCSEGESGSGRGSCGGVVRQGSDEGRGYSRSREPDSGHARVPTSNQAVEDSDEKFTVKISTRVCEMRRQQAATCRRKFEVALDMCTRLHLSLVLVFAAASTPILWRRAELVQESHCVVKLFYGDTSRQK